VDLSLDRRRWMNRRVFVMDLSDTSKRMETRIDGFLGQDILQEFSAVRIYYKSRVVEWNSETA